MEIVPQYVIHFRGRIEEKKSIMKFVKKIILIQLFDLTECQYLCTVMELQGMRNYGNLDASFTTRKFQSTYCTLMNLFTENPPFAKYKYLILLPAAQI